MTDDELMTKLEAATVEAIRRERPGIVYDRARLRGIHVELEIRNNGGVIEGETYVNRTANVRNILGSMPGRTGRPGDPGVNDQQTTPTTDPVRALENAPRTLLQLVANIDAALAAIKAHRAGRIG